MRFNTTDSPTVATVGVFTSQKNAGWGGCLFLFAFCFFNPSLLGHQCCTMYSVALSRTAQDLEVWWT